MSNFKILSDTSCDLSQELLEKYDIGLVPFYITFDGGATYVKDRVEISLEEFYDKLSVKGAELPKTSLPSVMDYADKFRPYLEDGRDVFCVCITSEFSGSYQSAVNAAEMLLEEFPERKIKVLDSRLVAFLQGLIVMDIAEYRNEGKSIDEVYDLVNSYKDDSYIYLTVNTLENLQRGGRIGKASALAGGLLNIKPIIAFEDGALHPHSKVRGRKKSLTEVVDLTAEFLRGKESEYRVWVLSSRFEDDAQFMASYAKEKGIPIAGIGKIGVAVTIHGGLGVIGIIMMKNRV